jgi:hypothetical protein
MFMTIIDEHPRQWSFSKFDSGSSGRQLAELRAVRKCVLDSRIPQARAILIVR